MKEKKSISILNGFLIVSSFIATIFIGCEGTTENSIIDINPPAEAKYANIPTNSSFDFSMGTIDTTGQAGDFRYNIRINTGLTAPSDVSWWKGESLSDFNNYVHNEIFLPPAEGWYKSSSTNGSAGRGTRWFKTKEHNYAIIFSIAEDDSHFEFYYVEPYGNFIWSDSLKPEAPVLTAVNPVGIGNLVIEWQSSSSPDVAGYWVRCGESVYEGSEKHAGLTTNYTWTNLESGKLYYIQVLAYDNEGNKSEVSNFLTGTAG